MASQIQQGFVYHGVNYYGVNDSDWSLLGATGPRQFTSPVTFSTTFVDSPVFVQLSLNSVFVLGDNGLKVDLQAVDVSQTGFTLQVATWDDCQIMGVGVQWIAVSL